MDIYSGYRNDAGQQNQAFEGNRDTPIIRQPSSRDGLFSGSGSEQVADCSSHIHAIEYLKSVDKLFIQQNIALLEAFLDIEVQNKYQVLNPLGQKVFLALEESGCCVRFVCGPLRDFTMHIFDNLNNEVIRMYRPLASQCCPFWMQKLDVFCPTDVLVGSVKQEFSCLHPRFGIFDKDGMEVLKIEGPICQCKCCNDVNYQITNETGDIVGTISKQWMGFLQEGFTDADCFRLEFSMDLDVNMKMVLLGAAFLLDYLYYEKNKGLLP